MYLLSSLVRCHYRLDDGTPCGSPMGGGQFDHADTLKLRCIAALAERRHPGGYAAMKPIEDAVVRWLGTIAHEVEQGADADAAAGAKAIRRAADAKRLGREIDELDQALTRLTAARADGLVPETAYAAARDEIEQQQRTLDARHREAALDANAGVPARIARQLLDEWDLPVEHRRGMLRELISEVRVAPGRPRCRVEIVPAWHA